jgi:hypothetical protein
MSAAKCACCGFTCLKSELDDYGNGSCCPSSKRVPRGRGERRTRLSDSKNQDEGGKEETPPLSAQFKLF